MLALWGLGLAYPAYASAPGQPESDSGKFFVRIGIGFNSQSKVRDVLSSPVEYSPFVTVSGGSALSAHLGLNYYLEGIYKFNPWVGCAVGFGYLAHHMIGAESPYTLRIVNQSDRVLNVTPKLTFEANYIYMAAVFSLPLSSALSFNVNAGGGYYFVDYTSETHWYPFFSYLGEDQYTSNFKGDHSTVGYHIKVGWDYKLFKIMTMTFEVLYRGVNLPIYNIPFNTTTGSTVQFLEWLEQEDITVFCYDIPQFQLPRVSFYMGVMFRF